MFPQVASETFPNHHVVCRYWWNYAVLKGFQRKCEPFCENHGFPQRKCFLLHECARRSLGRALHAQAPRISEIPRHRIHYHRLATEYIKILGHPPCHPPPSSLPPGVTVVTPLGEQMHNFDWTWDKYCAFVVEIVKISQKQLKHYKKINFFELRLVLGSELLHWTPVQAKWTPMLSKWTPTPSKWTPTHSKWTPGPWRCG